MGVFLMREERLVGEGVTVGSDAQVAPGKGETRAEQGEVGWVTPQGAAGAILGLRGVRWSEPGCVGAGEGVIDSQLQGRGCGASGVLGFPCLAAQVVLLNFHGSVPERVIAARGGFAKGVGEGRAVEGQAGGTELQGVLCACQVPFLSPLCEGTFASAGLLECG